MKQSDSEPQAEPIAADDAQVASAMVKLSEQQKNILECVYDNMKLYRHPERGVSLRRMRGRGPFRRSECASFSRALHRLCDRGLLIRMNTCSGLASGVRQGQVAFSDRDRIARADYIALTALGLEVTKRLTYRQTCLLTVCPTGKMEGKKRTGSQPAKDKRLTNKFVCMLTVWGLARRQ